MALNITIAGVVDLLGIGDCIVLDTDALIMFNALTSPPEFSWFSCAIAMMPPTLAAICD